MKLNIGCYEVEIKAKGLYGEKFNKKDTMHLLNSISIAFMESNKYNQLIFEDETIEYNKNLSKQIFEVLKKEGLYD